MILKDADLLKDKEKEGIRTTNEALFNTVNKYLKTLPELNDVFEILDYSLAGSTKFEIDFDEFICVECVVETGGSEGIYVSCYPVNVEGRSRARIGTYKTLGESMEAYMLMGKLAGAFTHAVDLYLYVNT